MTESITVWETGTAKSFTYIDLHLGHAEALVKMVEASGGAYLIAYASDVIAPTIHPRLRTSWFTHNGPPDEIERSMGLQ